MTPLYAGIGGVVRELTEMDAGINGVVTPLTEMWAGVDGVNRQIFSSGIPAGNLAIGDIVQLNENGVAQDYLCVHQGLPSSMYDSSCDGTWLLRKNIIEQRMWNEANVNSYASSSINTWLNNTMFGMYDTNIQSAIKQVKIPYCLGNGNTAVMSGPNGLSCRVFLISAYEVGFTDSIIYDISEDGALLDYFTTGISTEANNKRIATYLNAPLRWSLRTPKTQFTIYIAAVTVLGDDGVVSCTYTSGAGIRPCIILPQDFVL